MVDGSLLRALISCSLVGATVGYSLGSMPGMARGTTTIGAAATSLASLQANSAAVSFKGAGLCKKLEVPSELLEQVDVFIFDCDGVIWKGDSLIERVPAVLEMLRKAGKKVFFVTNNSTKSRKGYLGKFKSLGLEDTQAEEIFSSSFAAAAYLEQTKFKETGKKVYIIGEVGIEEELDLIGVLHAQCQLRHPCVQARYCKQSGLRSTSTCLSISLPSSCAQVCRGLAAAPMPARRLSSNLATHCRTTRTWAQSWSASTARSTTTRSSTPSSASTRTLAASSSRPTSMLSRT